MTDQAEQPERLDASELRDAWPIIAHDDRVSGFRILPRAEAEEFFLSLAANDQAELLMSLPQNEQRAWFRMLPPDDAADLVQTVSHEEKYRLLSLLDDPTRGEVNALLAYEEDAAGGLMNPRYARLRPDVSVDEAISYLRKQARDKAGTSHYVYVLDEQQRILGVVSFRDLFAAQPEKRVRDIMHTQLVTVREDQDQEAVGRVFGKHALVAIPVVDGENRIKGIVTADDIVDVVQEEATEDIQKIGGVRPLEDAYLKVSMFDMVRKRAPWLVVLFIGEMFTLTAMGHFEERLARAVILGTFIPLIISAGGNTGSQATTLVIRAMALGEVSLRDWWRVMRREILIGVLLGALLGTLGFLRIVVWQSIYPIYGQHYLLIAMTLICSLVGVVMFGTLAGSLLPFVLRRVGLDPASASAPFVATLVDVTGIVIYFTVATIMLTGTLL